MNQTTIARKVENIGIGLHKGQPIKLILEPAPANSGITFYRSDINASFKAQPASIGNTQMATVLGDLASGNFISTIEHLMSAINGLGIDNIKIKTTDYSMRIVIQSNITY